MGFNRPIPTNCKYNNISAVRNPCGRKCTDGCGDAKPLCEFMGELRAKYPRKINEEIKRETKEIMREHF